MPEKYAQALVAIIKKGGDAEKAASSLKDVLVRRKQLSLAPRIARALSREAEKAARAPQELLLVAREGDEAKARKESKVTGEMRVDSTLIGGWRAISKDTLVDASHKSQLQALYRRLVA